MHVNNVLLSPIGKGGEGSVPSIGQLDNSVNPLPKFVTSLAIGQVPVLCKMCKLYKWTHKCIHMTTDQLSAQVS